MFTLTYLDLEYETSISVWEFEVMIVLPSFQVATLLNSRNTYETVFHNESDTLFCIWILVFPIGIIDVTTPRDWIFWIYISSSHDSWPPRHVHIDISWSWIWNQYFCLGIWSDDRTKMIVLHSIQLATRLNSWNTYETVSKLIWHFNLYMNIGISNWHNCSYYTTRLKFLTL